MEFCTLTITNLNSFLFYSIAQPMNILIWYRILSVVVFCEDISLHTYNMSQYNEMIDKCKSSLHSSICCFMSDVSSTSIFSDITHLSGAFSTNYFYLSHTITLLLVFWNVTLQKQCLLIKQSFTH